MSADPNRGAGVHFPPPLYFVGAFLAGCLMHWRWPADSIPLDRIVRLGTGWTVAATGLALAGSAIFLFRRRRVSLIPFRPAPRLVRDGPYRVTRNPMYLGLALGYAGLAFILDLAWPLAFLPIAVALVDRLVIAPEERYLRTAFPEDYARFSASVRRWM